MKKIPEYLIPLLSLSISLVSLILACMAFTNFHVREVQKKQIEIVLDLTSRIQSEVVRVSSMRIHNGYSYTYLFSGNVVTIAKTINGEDLGVYKDQPVFFSEILAEKLEIEKFLYNPLLPTEIANALKYAFPHPVTYARSSGPIPEDFIHLDIERIMDAKVMDELETNDKDSVQEIGYYCDYGSSLVEFVAGMNNFRSATNSWLEDQGVDDLNIEWDQGSFRQFRDYSH